MSLQNGFKTINNFSRLDEKRLIITSLCLCGSLVKPVHLPSSVQAFIYLFMWYLQPSFAPIWICFLCLYQATVYNRTQLNHVNVQSKERKQSPAFCLFHVLFFLCLHVWSVVVLAVEQSSPLTPAQTAGWIVRTFRADSCQRIFFV